MKIVHLITGLGLGGAERQLKTLVTGQKNPSLSHVVISLRDEGVIGQHLVHQGIRVYCLNLHHSLKGFGKLYRILHQEKPDVLQTWLYHADLVGLIVGKLARIPRIVWNVRCSDMNMAHYSKITSWVVKALVVLSRFPNAIVVNSRAGQAFHEKLGYKSRQWVLIPNGIDTDLFRPDPQSGARLRRSLGIPEEAVVVGMLGRVDPMKDHLTFLRAMEILSQTHENLYCLVAGKGTKEADWLNLPPRLIRLGLWENAPEFLNALDIMVLASVFGEGFPNVVGEAMACGIPTIVTDVGDGAHLVGIKDCVVPAQDVRKLVVALERMLALSLQERKALGEQGRNRIVDCFSVPLMQQRYVSLYQSIDTGKGKKNV